MTSTDTPEALAEQLNTATRSGNLAAAYRVLQTIPPKQMEAVALRAGYSVIRTRSPRDLTSHVVGQVARAARHNTDGFGLRDTTPTSTLLQEARHVP